MNPNIIFGFITIFFSLFFALFIFLIGAPFFLVTNVLEYILDGILPEGWNDDDFFKRY